MKIGRTDYFLKLSDRRTDGRTDVVCT